MSELNFDDEAISWLLELSQEFNKLTGRSLLTWSGCSFTLLLLARANLIKDGYSVDPLIVAELLAEKEEHYVEEFQSITLNPTI